jgi:hypothetical protein
MSDMSLNTCCGSPASSPPYFKKAKYLKKASPPAMEAACMRPACYLGSQLAGCLNLVQLV